MTSINVSAESPRVASAEFTVGVRTVPYLADHAIQGMVVLPGSLFVEMARRVEGEVTGSPARIISHVTFHNPVILAGDDTTIHVEAVAQSEGRVSYTFVETATGVHAATLDVTQNSRTVALTGTVPPMPPSSTLDETAAWIEAFQQAATPPIDGDALYAQLGDNGNQYGPEFRRLHSVWRRGNEALGHVSVTPPDPVLSPSGFHPSVLDTAVQLLIPIAATTGRTFVLRSIERIEIVLAGLPSTVWLHAELVQDRTTLDQHTGTVRAFTESGEACFTLSGIAFSLLEGVEASEHATSTPLVIASNFTAEPVEESLQFWGNELATPLRVTFAPYNQIFQQLLTPDSAFHANRDGVNVVLLSLEESMRSAPVAVDMRRAEAAFGGRPRYTLPNGLQVLQLNQYETDHVYREIFEDQCYVRHGIHLPDNATVIDIGANIGLFSLYVMSRCKAPRILAFEPAPVVYELLAANCAAYGSSAVAVNAGVSDTPRTAAFTFYERSSVFSSFHANTEDDRRAIEAVVRNALTAGVPGADEVVDAYTDELTADRLTSTTHQIPLTTVSEIIREHKLEVIDLLKIDAEKSEVDIINGIGDSDWPRIRQLVIEIHDPTGQALRRVTDVLAARGFRYAVEHDTLLAGSGLFNLYATRDTIVEKPRPNDALQRTVQELTTALRTFTTRSSSPVVLCLCPATSGLEHDAGNKRTLDEAEATLLADVSTTPGVLVIPSAQLRQRYPVADYADAASRAAGHVPYTPAGYASFGTAIARALYSLTATPYKVIALDCDNTLWKGVCGEDGPLGVEISGPYRQLQEFMVRQAEAGMLLCLCSKNNEQDVLDVFAQRSDMVLRQEHFVARRLNWKSKAENLKSLAGELNLALDSFIFIDDNPVECAEVRSHCPEAVTLELPRNAESMAAFLGQVWAFDRHHLTDEDRQRTHLYQADTERRRFHDTTLSLKDFIDGLQLRIEIGTARPEDLPRLSQLTLRTNQFNFTTIRRSEPELREFLARPGAAALAVRVADRFGDYGLVGLILYASTNNGFGVDTFLLSCRVLGKGVEHAVLAHLGQSALQQGAPRIALTCRTTDRNAPARDFLASLMPLQPTVEGSTSTFDPARLAQLTYRPDETGIVSHDTASQAQASSAAATPTRVAGRGRAQSLHATIARFPTIDQVMRGLEERHGRSEMQRTTDVNAPRSLQETLLDIWKTVLRRQQVGLGDNFFEAGGTSLKAVQVVAMIKRRLDRDLSIVTLFECPTVASLASRLEGSVIDRDDQGDASSAALRGAKRRQLRRRKAS